MLVAARADPNGKDFVARTGEMSDRMKDYMVPEGDRPALLAACMRAYPQAYRTAPSTLPTDLFARDAVCLTSLGITIGEAQVYGKNGGDPSLAAVYKRTLDIISDRMTDKRLSDMGLNTDAEFQRYLADQLFKALSGGNTETIANACVASIR